MQIHLLRGRDDADPAVDSEPGPGQPGQHAGKAFRQTDPVQRSGQIRDLPVTEPVQVPDRHPGARRAVGQQVIAVQLLKIAVELDERKAVALHDLQLLERSRIGGRPDGKTVVDRLGVIFQEFELFVDAAEKIDADVIALLPHRIVHPFEQAVVFHTVAVGIRRADELEDAGLRNRIGETLRRFPAPGVDEGTAPAGAGDQILLDEICKALADGEPAHAEFAAEFVLSGQLALRRIDAGADPLANLLLDLHIHQFSAHQSGLSLFRDCIPHILRFSLLIM